MDRDDNNQQREEHEHQEWLEEIGSKNHKLLDGFDELRPIIQGKNDERQENSQGR